MIQSNGVPSKVTEERSGSCTVLGRQKGHYNDMGCLRLGIRAKEETVTIFWWGQNWRQKLKPSSSVYRGK